MSRRFIRDVGSFWANISVGSLESCWPWQRCLDRKGYGQIMHRGQCLRAHRIALFLASGALSLREAAETKVDSLVLHRCDTPACCNPNHLFFGTQTDNIIDMHSKWRNPTKKLSEEQVAQVRAAYVPRKVSTRQLAKDLGVSQSLIHQIISNRART